MKKIPWFIKRLIYMEETLFDEDLWEVHDAHRATWLDFFDAAQECTNLTSMKVVHSQAQFTDYDVVVDSTKPIHAYRVLDTESDCDEPEPPNGALWKQINEGRELDVCEVYIGSAIIERVSG